PIARGKWQSDGFFFLEKGALVKIKTSFDLNHEIMGIREELFEKNLLGEGNSKYYILKDDIKLPSPSAAASLVHGNSRSGRRDWKHSGRPLHQLLIINK